MKLIFHYKYFHYKLIQSSFACCLILPAWLLRKHRISHKLLKCVQGRQVSEWPEKPSSHFKWTSQCFTNPKDITRCAINCPVSFATLMKVQHWEKIGKDCLFHWALHSSRWKQGEGKGSMQPARRASYSRGSLRANPLSEEL